LRVCRHVPLLVSQIWTIQSSDTDSHPLPLSSRVEEIISQDADTNRVESGKKATEVT
jgi:hypothetical protein